MKSKIHISCFSKGAVVSIAALVNEGFEFASCFGVCCPYIGDQERSDLHQIKTKVLLINGKADPVLPHSMVEFPFGRLIERGLRFEHKTYEKLKHGFDDNVIADMQEFYQKQLI